MTYNKEMEKTARIMLMCSLVNTSRFIDITTGEEFLSTSGKYNLSKGDYFYHNTTYVGEGKAEHTDDFYLITTIIIKGESTIYGCVKSNKPFWYDGLKDREYTGLI